MISWPALNPMRWVNPSIATVSPSRTTSAMASYIEATFDDGIGASIAGWPAGVCPGRFSAASIASCLGPGSRQDEGELGSGAQVELAQDLGELGRDVEHGDLEQLGDLRVRHPLAPEPGHVRLAQAQPAKTSLLGHRRDSGPAQ